MLVMDITHGVMHMMHHGEMGEHGMEQCAPGMCGGMQCGHDGGACMHEGGKMHGMKCCDEDMEHGKGECSGEEHEHEHEHEGTMHADSAAKK
jgi:hypothetical protein